MEKQRKVVLFIAMSLDGYIATEDESLEWLFNVEGEGDNGYSEFYETVDTLIMGRKTYDWLINQDVGDFPDKQKACYVFTTSNIPDTEVIQFVNPDIKAFILQLKKQAGKNIWVVGGGELVTSFLEEGLIDEIIVTVAPVLLGRGIALFREGSYRTDLTLKRVRRFNQFVELNYLVQSHEKKK